MNLLFHCNVHLFATSGKWITLFVFDCSTFPSRIICVSHYQVFAPEKHSSLARELFCYFWLYLCRGRLSVYRFCYQSPTLYSHTATHWTAKYISLQWSCTSLSNVMLQARLRTEHLSGAGYSLVVCVAASLSSTDVFVPFNSLFTDETEKSVREHV